MDEVLNPQENFFLETPANNTQKIEFEQPKETKNNDFEKPKNQSTNHKKCK